MVVSLNRGLRDAMSQTVKLKNEHLEVVKRTEILLSQLEIEKVRRKSLFGLLEDTRKELQLLQQKSVSLCSRYLLTYLCLN